MVKFFPVFLISILISCQKEPEINYPLIQTGDVTDISNEGAIFHAKILNLGTDNITEYGFVWDQNAQPIVETGEKLIIFEEPHVGTIEAKILSTLQPGEMYFLRAFIKTSGYVIYGKIVNFKSQGSKGPQIASVFPSTGNINDTLIITGKNFSYIPENNNVTFSNLEAEVISSSQDTLTVRVPSELNTVSSKVKVSVLGNTAQSELNFNLVQAEITGFSPAIASYGSLITITGNNFLENRTSVQVFFDQFQGQVLEINEHSLVVTVPNSLNLQECDVSVRMNNISVVSAGRFRLATFTLTEFSPQILKTGETLHIKGEGFSEDSQNIQVTIGGLAAEITRLTGSEMDVIIPSQTNGTYPGRSVSIQIQNGPETKSFNEQLTINDEWFRLEDFPGREVYGNIAAVYQNKILIKCDNSSELWEYNVTTNNYKLLNDFPGKQRYNGTGFIIGDKFYYGTGLHVVSEDGVFISQENLADLWEFDLTQNQWTQKVNFAGSPRAGAFGFSLDGYGYIGGGADEASDGFKDVWKFNPYDESWIRVADYPIEYFGYWNAAVTTHNSDAYVGLGINGIQGDFSNRLYRYNSTANQWIRQENLPGNEIFMPDAIGFTINDLLYFKVSAFTDFWTFDVFTGNWNALSFPYSYTFNRGIGVSLNGKGYFGLGDNHTFWEYDPNR